MLFFISLFVSFFSLYSQSIPQVNRSFKETGTLAWEHPKRAQNVSVAQDFIDKIFNYYVQLFFNASPVTREEYALFEKILKKFGIHNAIRLYKGQYDNIAGLAKTIPSKFIILHEKVLRDNDLFTIYHEIGHVILSHDPQFAHLAYIMITTTEDLIKKARLDSTPVMLAELICGGIIDAYSLVAMQKNHEAAANQFAITHLLQHGELMALLKELHRNRIEDMVHPTNEENHARIEKSIKDYYYAGDYEKTCNDCLLLKETGFLSCVCEDDKHALKSTMLHPCVGVVVNQNGTLACQS